MSLYSKIVDLQKLGQAWEKVRKNKPAAGVDHVTWEMFDRNLKIELKQLNLELINHEYQCLPVKNVVLNKDEKLRVIALYSMRDKVVQQSIAQELTKLYDGEFSDSCFAYRPNKSALSAIEQIEKGVLSDRWKYALKLDIHHFFDEIDSGILENMLGRKIAEKDVLSLIRKGSAAPMLEENGNLKEKTSGIHQGSSIAPILSNIYMWEFDKKFSDGDVIYVRYSDDMVVLAETLEKAAALLESMKTYLEKLCLRVNDKKTYYVRIEEGFDFLGYHFDGKGKTVPVKAEENLNAKQV